MSGSSYDGFLNSGIIEDKILNRDWTLNDVLNMDETIDIVVQELIDEMDIETKYLIVKDVKVKDAVNTNDITVANVISKALREELSDMVSFVVNQYLKEAKVKFDDNNSTDNMVNNKNTEIKMVDEKEVEQLLVNPSKDEKILTLKERIRKDSKRLNEQEMKDKGMI